MPSEKNTLYVFLAKEYCLYCHSGYIVRIFSAYARAIKLCIVSGYHYNDKHLKHHKHLQKTALDDDDESVVWWLGLAL